MLEVAIYLLISLLSMILIAFMQKYKIINNSSDFAIILGGFAWFITFPLLLWVFFYDIILKNIFNKIKVDSNK